VKERRSYERRCPGCVTSQTKNRTPAESAQRLQVESTKPHTSQVREQPEAAFRQGRTDTPLMAESGSFAAGEERT